MSAPKAKLPKPSHPRHGWRWPSDGGPCACAKHCGWTIEHRLIGGRLTAVYTHPDGRRVERPKLMWRDVPCIPRAK